MTEIERKRAKLERLWYIEEELKNIDLEYEQIASDIRGIKAMEYNDMPSAHKITDLSDKMVMLEERTKELTNSKKELLDEKYKIIQGINNVKNPMYRNILMLKYVKGIRNDELCRIKGYSSSSIKREIKKAITYTEFK